MIVGLQGGLTHPEDATCAPAPPPSVENEATPSALISTPKRKDVDEIRLVCLLCDCV
jgi:hypothetical protein